MFFYVTIMKLVNDFSKGVINGIAECFRFKITIKVMSIYIS